MRVLIAANGSYGDIHPFLALGRELKGRGHDVHFVAGADFAPAIRSAGLEPVPIGPVGLYDEITHHPDAFHPRKGFRIIAQATLDYLPESYRRMEERVVPGETLAIGSTLALATRLLQERRSVPTATVHLAPSIFRSAIEPSQIGETPVPRWLPRPLRRLAWRIVDAVFVDPVFGPELNRFRRELGLPAIRRIFHDWIHEADAVVGLFPDWFAAAPPDWPARVRLTGFPLYDGGTSRALPPEVEAFLGDGEPPVVFTSGTAAASEHAFFRESAEACRIAGRRGLLLARYPDQIPRELPDAVRYFDYVPFSALLPEAAALVHHGGVGTLSQGLAAGVPQLVRPLAFDQHDNAARLERLGVGRTLAPKRYRAEEVAAALDELTESAAVREAARSVSRKLEGTNATRETVDVILRELL